MKVSWGKAGIMGSRNHGGARLAGIGVDGGIPQTPWPSPAGLEFDRTFSSHPLRQSLHRLYQYERIRALVLLEIVNRSF